MLNKLFLMRIDMKVYFKPFIFSFVLNVLIFVVLMVPILYFGSQLFGNYITYNNVNLLKCSIILGTISTIFDMFKIHKAIELRKLKKDKKCQSVFY